MVETITADKIFSYLAEIPDPDIPVVNIVEMGMIRGIDIKEEEVIISITPTYSGCPATKMISEDILSLLKVKGISNVRLKMVYAPAWSTDWMKDGVKQKLKEYGITPPEKIENKKDAFFSGLNKKKACPHCNSTKTKITSEFGSTPCKAIYHCNNCCQPFEVFKCI